MAVRRVSDLPNLDIVYPGAELSDCLVEVSYAAPNNPRRYQSFYENVLSAINKIPYAAQSDVSNFYITIKNLLGNYLPLSSTVQTSADIVAYPEKYPDGQAIMDYIDSFGFLTPEALGPMNDATDLINSIMALLNTKDLYLFIAQTGVRASDVVTSSGQIRYDIVDSNGGRTLVWKEKPSSYDEEFNTKFYAAERHDLIFFKTIQDAMSIAQRFKFLQGSGIYIKICTDLVEPLYVEYTVNGTTATLNNVQPLSPGLSHSDNCVLTITGTKIIEVKRSYGNDGNITSHYVNMHDTTRIIFRDNNSLYTSRYNYYMSSQITTSWNYILFDGGSITKWDNTTYSNYCIDSETCNNTTTFDHVGFLMHEIPIIGQNLYVKNCSFTWCDNCVHSTGGISNINGAFEALSCMNIAKVENGKMYRDGSIRNGNMYIQSRSNANFGFGYPTLNGTVSLYNYITYIPWQPNQFMKWSGTEWSYVSYDDMKNMVLNNDSSLQNCIVNPKYNSMIPYINSNVVTCDTNLSTFDQYVAFISQIQNDANYSSAYFDYYQDALEVVYNGYTKRGYNNTPISMIQQIVISKSTLFNNYATDRLNSNSILRKAYDEVEANFLNFLWNMDYYKNNYTNNNHYMSNNINTEQFTVYVNNVYNHTIFAESFNIAPANYSLAYNWRSADYPANSAHWGTIPAASLETFLDMAIQKFGYIKYRKS